MNGYRAMNPNRIPGMTTPGIRMFSDSVYPNSVNSGQPGIRRNAPSMNRMYQSGWAPAGAAGGAVGAVAGMAVVGGVRGGKRGNPEGQEEDPPALALQNREEWEAGPVAARAAGPGVVGGLGRHRKHQRNAIIA